MNASFDRAIGNAGIVMIASLLLCGVAAFWMSPAIPAPALAVFAFLAGIAAAIAAGAALWRRSLSQLGLLGAATRQIAAGDLDTPLPSVQRGDQIGALARSVAGLRDQLKAAREAKAAQTETILSTIGNGLACLANGDLDARVTTVLDGPLAQLGNDFNAAAANLLRLNGLVLASTSGIRAGAGAIAEASETLGQRTEANAASLEQSCAALGQIDMRLMLAAKTSAETLQRADQALATVADGRSTAQDSVVAMKRVNASAEGIDAVIEGLDKIAFQTRVLAMNAAVEAGRAGEAGRGFAVVADLVSALAMRAEEEAKRARAQLGITQNEIGLAVAAVRKVDGALLRISGDVAEVHGLLGEMAADNQAQAGAVHQISAAIAMMDKASRQNAALVERSSEAARSLSSEVDSLAELVASVRNPGGESETCRGPAPRHFVPRKASATAASAGSVRAAR